jgi:hypothetical protein
MTKDCLVEPLILRNPAFEKQFIPRFNCVRIIGRKPEIQM